MTLSRRHVICACALTIGTSTLAKEPALSHITNNTHPIWLTVLLYAGFETIDALGPVEMLGYVKNYSVRFVSLEGGIVRSAQGVPIITEKFNPNEPVDVVLIPGAAPQFLKLKQEFFTMIRQSCEKAQKVLTICTGSFLLAQTGLLDERKATSNKNALSMVIKAVPKVLWQKKARWVVDGKFYTSSGITAGMDMALGFVSDIYGPAEAKRIAAFTEYLWSEDPANDPFAKK